MAIGLWKPDALRGAIPSRRERCKIRLEAVMCDGLRLAKGWGGVRLIVAKNVIPLGATQIGK
jgi:hypothetical protein